MRRANRSGRLLPRAAGFAVVLALAVPAAASAQLISPGKLAEAHAELEGIRGCTACHELGKPGVAPARCLECHEPLRTRIEDGRGYHARVSDRNCGECHKEHFGRDFAMIRLDTASFRHDEAGYTLRGSHIRVSCRDCHTAEFVHAPDVRAFDGRPGFLGRTMLGLSTECAACHAPDDPHGGQFPDRGCDACHDERDWREPVRFDHDRTDYPLTGRHARVACEGCHTAEAADGRVRFVGLAFDSCASCHADPHRGAMGATCASCHDTGGWHRVASKAFEGRFDHGRTRFPLAGAHATLQCAACHGKPARRTAAVRIRYAAGTAGYSYPRPIAADCASCHVDHHTDGPAAASTGASCDGCHTERGWTPTSYGIDRHNRTATFPLTGAHEVTPCADCHVEETARGPLFRLRLPDRDCVACHVDDDPHGDRFAGISCADCHDTGAFRLEAIDHARAGGFSCVDCHERQDPHGGQFADASCDRCHDTASFRIERFDHERTRFPLEGAHVGVACGACHRAKPGEGGRPVVVYRPLGTACRDCHGGGE